MRNRKKKDRIVPRRTSVMSMTLSSYANQIRNLAGAAGQILGFLGQIDDTGQHIGSTDVRTAASAFGCSESDVEDALSMFKMAKEAEQKENRRDMSKTREGNIKEAFPTCFEDALCMFKMAKEAEQKENRRDVSKTIEGLTSNEQAVAEGRQIGTAADKGKSSNRKSWFWSFK